MSSGAERIEALRREIVATSHQVHARGWVANHDGNLTARLSETHLLCTPTAVSKGDVLPAWLIVVDGDNAVVEGSRRAFSELQLHRAAYGARPDITVVIHAHPPCATAFALAGVPLPHPVMAEPIVTLGAVIPMVPYSRPGSQSLTDDIGAGLQQADVLLLEQHGVLAVGGSFEQAFLRLELLEHMAKIALAAQQLGGARLLPSAEVAALSKKGRPASSPLREQGPAVDAPRRSSVPQARPAADVGALVAEALKRHQ